MSEYGGIYRTIGPPGTGKTTWLSKQVRAIVERVGSGNGGTSPVLVCSLTKTAAAEVAGRDLPLPRDAVGTLHAHCYRLLEGPGIATGKALKDWNDKHPQYALSIEGGLSDIDEPTGEVMGNEETPGDRLLESLDLYRHRRISPDLWLPEIANFAEDWEEWKTSAELYDFTDLIDSVLEQELPPPLSPRIVLADEAQDLSALEYALLRHWAACAGALIVVGDPHQALYTWRGAHPDIFLDSSVPADRHRVLSQSYRLPQKHVRAALAWARELSSGGDAITYRPRTDANGATVEGSIEPAWGSWRAPADIVDLAASRLASGESVMLAAPCSYMVSPLVTELRRRGIPFANPWRTSRGDWNPFGGKGTSMISRVFALFRPADPGSDGLWTHAELAAWATKIRADGTILRGGKKTIEDYPKEQAGARVTEETLRTLFVPAFFDELLGPIRRRGYEPENVEHVLTWFADRLSGDFSRPFEYAASVIRSQGIHKARQAPKCFVGTIHSFKGAEAENVILFPDLSQAAARAWTSADAELRDSVVRTFYVGMTRSRSNLYIARPASSEFSVPIEDVAGASA